jgi:alanyl aminopeptidase
MIRHAALNRDGGLHRGGWLGTLFFVLCAVSAVGQQPPDFRLSSGVVPSAYTVDLTLIPAEPRFHCKIAITLDIIQPTPLVWLNGTGLTIEAAEVSQQGQVQPAEIVAGGEDFIGFRFAKALAAGKGELRIAYTAKISPGGDGLFRRDYEGAAYLLTQFEPDSARRVFPCFDEPGLKASWQFTLHIPRDQVGLTNGPVESETPEPGGIKAIRFARTEPLSTYLVALAVGPYEIVEAGRGGKSQTPVRIIAPKGEAAGAKFAAETTPRVLDWFEDYLGVPYAFGKLDLVANPGCSGGAMEHPGLITFCGPQLVTLPEQDFPKRQRDFTRVIAHEMAHQWFGNLVTPAWWDDLWLSEGFANWLQGKYIQATHPEWNFRAEELRNRFATMQRDGLATTRRLHEPVSSKADISNTFGPIAYIKGEAVLAMFDEATGDQKFRRALRRYLEAHRFGTATSDDLIAALRAEGGRQLADAFAKFIHQPGVPLIRASLRCSANKPPTVHVQQERSASVPGENVPPQLWDIPVCLAFAGKENHPQCEWLNSPATEVTLLGETACPSWVQLNPGAAGYFRTAYDEGQFQKLIDLGWEHLSLVDRIVVLDDWYALVLDGSVPAATALWAIERVVSTFSPEGILGAAEVVKGIGAILPPESSAAYANYVQRVFGEHARSLGWVSAPREDPRQRLLRGVLVLFVAVEGQDEKLQLQARTLASKWMADRTSVDPEVTGSVLIAAAHAGDQDLFDRYLGALRGAVNPREKRLLLLALGSFQNVSLEERTEGLILSDNVNFWQWLTAMGARPARPEFAAKRFQFVKEHIDAILESAKPEERNELLAELPNVADGACNEDVRRNIEAFIRPRLAAVRGSDSSLTDVLTSISACARRREIQASSLREYLSAQ